MDEFIVLAVWVHVVVKVEVSAHSPFPSPPQNFYWEFAIANSVTEAPDRVPLRRSHVSAARARTPSMLHRRVAVRCAQSALPFGRSVCGFSLSVFGSVRQAVLSGSVLDGVVGKSPIVGGVSW